MEFLLQNFTSCTSLNKSKAVDEYNEAINVTQNSLPEVMGLVILISVTSGAIFVYSCYVLVRALKIYQRNFVLIVVSLIIVGTMGGTIAVGL